MGNNTLEPQRISDLVQAMNGNPSTHNWDVVVSYSIKQINESLVEKYNAKKIVTEIKFDIPVVLKNESYIIRYDINFDPPVLSFIAGESKAKLVMKIGKGSNYLVIKDNTITQTKPIPENQYSLKMTVPLAVLHGTTGKIIESGNIVNFVDHKEEEAHVILHFKNAESISIDPTSDPEYPEHKELFDILDNYFLPYFSLHFAKNMTELDYALAGLNNYKLPSNQLNLAPKSFVFSTMASSDGQYDVLSLYIQTNLSNSQGSSIILSFKPGDTAILPIPQGKTASVIISRDLIANFLIKPQLESKGYKVSFVEINKGLWMKLKTNTCIIADSKEGKVIFERYKYEGLNIKIDNNNPLNIQIVDSTKK